MNEWIEYEVDSSDCIPIERWGKDHWATLAYLECRVVDNRGIVKNEHMRCEPRLHREFAHSPMLMAVSDKKYPTILNDGEINNHDDWSCLEDMVAAGLLRAWWKQIRRQPFGNSKAKVELTERGETICGELRKHKAKGGNWANFNLSRLAN